nr:hypothetical protein [Bacteroides sp.]
MKQPHPKRRRVFIVLALILPLALLVLVELTLRMCHYGYNPSLFVEDASGKYYLMNQMASRPYFTVKENSTKGNIDFFRKEKADSTLRIFVLGASTNVGFPYMHNGSFPRMLAYRIQMENPERRVEMVNLSLTAISSFVVADFAEQLARYKPDAVLIYTGHNEYYGAMGVASTASTSGVWLNRLIVGLSRFKLGQWAVDFAARIKGVDDYVLDPKLNLMERMVAEKVIPKDGKDFQIGISRYDSNLSRAVRSLTEAGVPVYLATVTSNLRSLKPFNSAGEEWKQANKLLAQGDTVAALAAFVNAKDTDGLRFRAPEAINEHVREIARTYKGVTLVDVDSAFRAASPGGIPGEELFLEHVHPNLTGHAIIADRFYHAMADNGQIPRRSTVFDDYPLTAMDEHYGQIENWLLRENWPFNEPVPDYPPGYVRTFEEQVAGALAVNQIAWHGAMQMLLERYIKDGNPEGALKVAEGLWLDNPYNGEFALQAAQAASAVGDVSKTLFYKNRAISLGVPEPRTYRLISVAKENEED